MNRRIIGMVMSVVLAAIGTFAILSYVKRADDRARAGETTVEVLVVDTPVARGTPVDEVAKAVTAEQIPVRVRADGSVSSLAGLSGTVTAVDLVPGEQVVAARFVDPVELVNESAIEIPEGYLEVTVALEPQRVIGGQPSPGELVAVVASFSSVATETEEEGTSPPVAGAPEEAATVAATHIILHKVLITNIQANEPAPQAAQPADVSTVQYAPAPGGSLLVTFALPAPDVERLVYVAEFGNIWLAREPVDAPEDGTEVQTAQVIFR